MTQHIIDHTAPPFGGAADREQVPVVETETLANVTGGSLSELAKGGFGLRTLYRSAVTNITAGVGGWKLANQMYGTPEHGASLEEKWRARGALKEYLDGAGKLPSWAPNW